MEQDMIDRGKSYTRPIESILFPLLNNNMISRRQYFPN